ncbi:MAG: hypothetical protein ACI4PW_04610, partial [Alphaproteobacteria bacterium]
SVFPVLLLSKKEQLDVSVLVFSARNIRFSGFVAKQKGTAGCLRLCFFLRGIFSFPVLLLSKKEQLDVSVLAFFCEEYPFFLFCC